MPDALHVPSDAQLDAIGFAQMAKPGSSGIDVIVVGCGFAGITCAIESIRKGHTVTILEKYEEMRMIGMFAFCW